MIRWNGKLTEKALRDHVRFDGENLKKKKEGWKNDRRKRLRRPEMRKKKKARCKKGKDEIVLWVENRGKKKLEANSVNTKKKKRQNTSTYKKKRWLKKGCLVLVKTAKAKHFFAVPLFLSHSLSSSSFFFFMISTRLLDLCSLSLSQKSFLANNLPQDLTGSHSAFLSSLTTSFFPVLFLSPSPIEK